MAEGGLSINRSQESIDERSLDHDSALQVPSFIYSFLSIFLSFFLFFVRLFHFLFSCVCVCALLQSSTKRTK